MNRRRAQQFGTWIRWFCFVFELTTSVGATGIPGKPVTSASGVEVSPPPEEPVESGSPRACMAEYLRLCRSNRYAEAARYLDVAPSKLGQAPLLAKRLKAVIDRYVWIDLETISPHSQGDTNDELPGAYEAVAKIPSDSGKLESVRLFRRAAIGGSPAWVVSRSTVEHIDEWYESLPQVWLLDHLPAWLLRSGPRELLVWQWIAFPLLFVAAWGLGALLGSATRRVIRRVTSRTSAAWDDQLLLRLRGPLTLIWALSVVYAVLPFLGLYKPADEFVRSLLRGGYYFALFWSISRLIDGWGRAIADSPWATERSSAKAIVPIGVGLAKILLLIVAVVALVTAMGYPAASIVAGLGIGGLAVALAAQKTIENLFGAFTLGADQPFRVGDFVKIEDFLGHIESIGMRSTRIRTLDRTVITIPNGRLSEMRIENYSVRDRFRLACNLTLVYGTTAAQMREVLEGCERILLEHPKVWSEGTTVRFKELGESALIVEVAAWFQTADFAEFQRVREVVLLGMMAVVERAEVAFAFPTKTVQLVSDCGTELVHRS